MNVESIIELVAGLWPNWKPTATIATVWKAVLGGDDLERVSAAVVAHATRSQWPPTLADLRGILESEEPAADDDLRAIDAQRQDWSKNRYASDPSSNTAGALPPLTDRGKAAAELVWGQYWLTSEKSTPTDRRQFLASWGAEKVRVEDVAALDRGLALAGIAWRGPQGVLPSGTSESARTGLEML